QNELNRHRIASASDPDSPLVALYAGSGGFESFGGIDWRIDVETEPSAMHPNVRWRIVEARVRDAASQDPLARLETLEWSQ
ncbi:MAG: hypothetical protein J4F97_05475, partial [Pseudomonadales bacterium]|nr:hypothetical protein [Pseudomonadales bacterium]